MTQTCQVIETMKRLGGVSTFGKLNAEMDFSNWKTKTPEASVRRIVQQSNAFVKLRPGLWALKENEREVRALLNLEDENVQVAQDFSHSYYQGLAVEIGNFLNVDTFVPNQDKNRRFLEKPLKEITSLPDIYPFSYSGIINRAKTVDVIWFNKRRMPCAFFEIEHTTDIQSSLIKFYELQDFNAKFFIVADEYRHSKFDEIISRSIFEQIKNRIEFMNYDSLSENYEKSYRQYCLSSLL
jgi:hypothetical protein